jgi:hypothetical protein
MRARLVLINICGFNASAAYEFAMVLMEVFQSPSNLPLVQLRNVCLEGTGTTAETSSPRELELQRETVRCAYTSC